MAKAGSFHCGIWGGHFARAGGRPYLPIFGLSYFSCLLVGLWEQPEPFEVDPHQMHLFAP